ncbi:MAG: hypothetical protein ACHP91_16605, partial [Burkholderiales bacterium]
MIEGLSTSTTPIDKRSGGGAADAESVAEQLAKRELSAIAASAPSTPAGPTPRLGMGPRVGRARGAAARGVRPAAPPPDLLSIGVVEVESPSIIAAAARANGTS